MFRYLQETGRACCGHGTLISFSFLEIRLAFTNDINKMLYQRFRLECSRNKKFWANKLHRYVAPFWREMKTNKRTSKNFGLTRFWGRIDRCVSNGTELDAFSVGLFKCGKGSKWTNKIWFSFSTFNLVKLVLSRDSLRVS